MKLSENFKVERFDEYNFALMEKIKSLPKDSSKVRTDSKGYGWKAIRYYDTFEHALRDGIEHLVMGKYYFDKDSIEETLKDFESIKAKIKELSGRFKI